MTKDELIAELASLPDDGMDPYQEVDVLHDLINKARVLQPREPIQLRHIHLDNHWPAEVAVVPLRVHGDTVDCWVGRPEDALRLTLGQLEEVTFVTKTIRFFQEACTVRPGLEELPF